VLSDTGEKTGDNLLKEHNDNKDKKDKIEYSSSALEVELKNELNAAEVSEADFTNYTKWIKCKNNGLENLLSEVNNCSRATEQKTWLKEEKALIKSFTKHLKELKKNILAQSSSELSAENYQKFFKSDYFFKMFRPFDVDFKSSEEIDVLTVKNFNRAMIFKEISLNGEVLGNYSNFDNAAGQNLEKFCQKRAITAKRAFCAAAIH
jgi:hypothetical protein